MAEFLVTKFLEMNIKRVHIRISLFVTLHIFVESFKSSFLENRIIHLLYFTSYGGSNFYY